MNLNKPIHGNNIFYCEKCQKKLNKIGNNTWWCNCGRMYDTEVLILKKKKGNQKKLI